MKKLKIFAFILFSTTIIFGQSYIPVLEKGNQWNIIAFDDYFGPGHTERTWCTYKQIIGDTVTINNKVYNQIKLIKKNDCHERENSHSIYTKDFLIREDTLKKQIYLLEENSNSSFEKLLYDFSLKPNDTIVHYSGSSNTPVYVLRVDSIKNVEFSNGFNTKIFYNSIKFAYETEYIKCCTWIEGVGGYEGLRSYELVGTVGWVYYSKLLCFKKNNELIYMNPKYETCNENSSAVDDLIPGEFSLYPNPVEDNLTIESQEGFEADRWQIYNIIGQKIITGEVENPFKFEISGLEKLQTGIYLLKIADKKGRVSVGRFGVE